MKDKTCAAYVCAFLLLVIVVGVFVLSGKSDEAVKPSDGNGFEQTVEQVPERDDHSGVELAQLPKAKPQEGANQKTEAIIENNAGEQKQQKPKPEAKVEADEKNTGNAGLSVQEQLVKEVYDTAEVKVQNGKIVVSYKQPDIPPAYHLTVKAEVYDRNGATVCRYVSDGGWLADPSKYDASAKEILASMGAGDLTDKMFILVVKVGDANLSVGATVWQLTQNYDGSRTLETAYVQ